MADLVARRFLRALAAIAIIALLPLFSSASSNASVDPLSRRPSKRATAGRRRALQSGGRAARWRRQDHGSAPHIALLDAASAGLRDLLGDDYEWALQHVPMLDFDASVSDGAALLTAYFFRWRVFRRHLRRRDATSETAARASGGAAVDPDTICCSGPPCTLVDAGSGWCAGARSEAPCHRSRTEGRPCVWASGRCGKGHPHGAPHHGPSCPSAPRAPPTVPAASADVDAAAWVVTEFEPQVAWAGVANTIACSAGHHFIEGRWLRDSRPMDEYARFWFTDGGGNPRAYSFWPAAALLSRHAVTGGSALLHELYAPLSANYRAWMASHYSEAYACIWQSADRDGQEHSIGGDGCRPLLNAAMHAEARALATIAARAGDDVGARFFIQEARRWQHALLTLWSAPLHFFVTRAVPRPPTAPRGLWSERQRERARELTQGACPPQWPEGQLVNSRELQGLSSPWYFEAVPSTNASRYAKGWARLFASDGLAARWGPRTAERGDRCYNYTTPHECPWNGPSWPFETSKVISAAANVLHHYPANVANEAGLGAERVWALLAQYARAHTHGFAVNASAWLLSGTGSAWIGESLHPDEGYWCGNRRLQLPSGLRTVRKLPTDARSMPCALLPRAAGTAGSSCTSLAAPHGTEATGIYIRPLRIS